MNNVKSIITKHNAHIIRNRQSQNIRKLTTVTATTKTLAHYRNNVWPTTLFTKPQSQRTTRTTLYYIGMTATTFKERYANHTSSFRHKKDSNKTDTRTFETYLEIKRKQSRLYHQMVNFKTLYLVHRGIKTLQFMFGRKILHFERHKQR
jgi:hypothetical protein